MVSFLLCDSYPVVKMLKLYEIDNRATVAGEVYVSGQIKTSRC